MDTPSEVQRPFLPSAQRPHTLPTALELGFDFPGRRPAPKGPAYHTSKPGVKTHSPSRGEGLGIPLPTWSLASGLCRCWLPDLSPCLLTIKILKDVGPASAWYPLACLVHPHFLGKGFMCWISCQRELTFPWPSSWVSRCTPPGHHPSSPCLWLLSQLLPLLLPLCFSLLRF